MHARRRVRALLPVVLLTMLACTGNPVQTSMSVIPEAAPISDTFLIERDPHANPSLAEFFAIGTDTSGTRARAVMRLDLAPLADVLEATSDVESAHLILTRAFLGGTPAQVGIYPLLRPAGIAADTADTTGWSDWVHRTHPTEAWGVPGGEAGVDYDAAAPLAVIRYNTPVQQDSIDVSAWVRAVMDGVTPNHGFFIKMTIEGGAGNSVGYFSWQALNTAAVPRLEVALFSRRRF